MGNNCKSFDKLSNRFGYHVERTHYKTRDHYKHKICELSVAIPHDVACTKVQPSCTSELGRKGISCPTQDVQNAELVRICSKNRPVGVSDVNWERLLSSVCFEYSWNDVKGEFDTSAGMVTAIWATPSPRSPSRSSENANMGTWMDKTSRRSSSSTNYSSVEFAGRYVFPSDYPKARSPSQSSVSAQSVYRGQSERSYAKCFIEDSSESDLGTTCDLECKSSYTFRLGDLPGKSSEDYKSYDENKIYSKSSNEHKISPNVYSTFTVPDINL
jgi:hypothetical protein